MSSKSRRTGSAQGRPTPPESSDFLDDYTPFRIDTSAPRPEDGPRVPLFYVDDREYSVPERISGGLALRALEVSATEGADSAAYFLVVEALGKEAVRELTEGEASNHVTFEQVKGLFHELGRRFFGQMREATGGK